MPEMKNTLEKTYNENESHYLNLLSQLVSINSYSYNKNGVDSVQNILGAYLEKLGLKVTYHEDPIYGKHINACTDVESKDEILIVGHADTVHPDDGTFKDFSIDSSYAYGPGVYDMKGPLVMLCAALSLIKDNLKKIPLRVLIVSDEEIGFPSSREIHYRLAKTAKCAIVVEFGRGDDLLILSRKGISVFDITVEGRSAHSGNNHSDGINAIEEISKIILDISKLSNPEKGYTSNVGTVSGGTAVNTVPDFARAKFDLRFKSNKSYEHAKERIINILEGETYLKGSIVSYRESLPTPAMVESKEAQELFQSYGNVGSEIGIDFKRNLEPAGGASSANLISDAGVTVIDAVGPLGEGAHSHQEKISLQSFKLRTLCLANWLLNQKFK